MRILRLCHRRTSTYIQRRTTKKRSVLIPPLKRNFPVSFTAASEKEK
jgi:hypothetical protein